MRKLIYILLLAVNLAGSAIAQQHTIPAPEISFDAQWLKSEIESIRKKAGIPALAVGIYYKDKVVFAEGFGTRTEGKEEKVDEHTLFGIASNTKAFTAMGILMLAEQGKLTLDDKVSKHLPWFRAYNEYVSNEMTVKDLLTHHSGLNTFSGDLIWYASSHTREEIVKRSQHLVPVFGFRDKYGYSNIHYLAAGLVIEKVSGMGYDAFLQKYMFDPLKMTETNSTVSKNPTTNVASPHAIKDGKNIPVPYVNWDNIAPAGSINSNVHDMLKWLSCLMKNTNYAEGKNLLNASSFATMLNPVTPQTVSAGSKMWFPTKHFAAYALGLNVFDLHGSFVASHSGGLVGMVSQTAFVPEKQIALVVLSNNETGVPSLLMYDLLDYMMGQKNNRITEKYIANMLAGREADKKEFDEKWKDAKTGLAPKDKAEAYAGKYSGNVYGSVTVAKNKNGLHLQFDHTPIFHADLNYWKDDIFWFEFPEFPSLTRGTVTFVRDENKAIKQIVIDVPNPDFDFTELDLKKQ